MRPFRNPITLLKSHFFSGLMVLIPFGVIAWIIWSVLTSLWSLQTLIPAELRPENFIADPALANLVRGAVTFGAALILALGVSITGWVSKQFLGRKILEWAGEIIQHIPIIRSIHSALDQLLKTLGSGGGQQFNRVVYVEYPRKDMWTLAFVTGPTKSHAIPEKHLNVYVPTTPNPTSGFYLIVAESEVRESHMKVEEAFKTILSLGIAQNG